MPPYPRELLLQRAGYRCEYCLLPEAHASLGLHIDHVIARQHGGGDEDSNLAMACAHCNNAKGPNIASIDPTTRQMVRLFNPRTDRWQEHFALVGDEIRGLSIMGRATAFVLDMNNSTRVHARRLLRRHGVSFGK